MKNKFLQRLLILENLREFVQEIHTPEIHLKNLVIEGKEHTNLRLWVLRCMLGLSEEMTAKRLNISLKEYKRYEKRGTKVPEKILKKISRKFGVSLKWLKCKSYEWFPEIKNKG